MAALANGMSDLQVCSVCTCQTWLLLPPLLDNLITDSFISSALTPLLDNCRGQCCSVSARYSCTHLCQLQLPSFYFYSISTPSKITLCMAHICILYSVHPLSTPAPLSCAHIPAHAKTISSSQGLHANPYPQTCTFCPATLCAFFSRSFPAAAADEQESGAVDQGHLPPELQE